MEMGEENGHSRKNEPLKLVWSQIFGDDDDHPPLDLVVTPAKKSKVGGAGDEQEQPQKEDPELQKKTEHELRDFIERNKKTLQKVGQNLRDKGKKLKDKIREFEEELERRQKRPLEKGTGCEDTVQLYDRSDDGVSCKRKKGDQKSLHSFGEHLSKKLEEDEKEPRTVVNKFREYLPPYIKPCERRRMTKNVQLSDRGRSRRGFLSRPSASQSPSLLSVDSEKQTSSNGDKEGCNSATSSPHHFDKHKPGGSSPETSAPQDPPSRNLRPRHTRAFYLVDEEEPQFQSPTTYPEKLDDCMRDVKVYYPSRNDPDSVEVIYSDMSCLGPEACLSSTIMNFYIRYLQQSTTPSESAICSYHFFNTYFYNKLQKLSYKEDSFLKFRKWWKGVNIFEKAYILLPVHENAHWSLVIICMPTKEDKLGPSLLHLDSLGLHDSRSIFDNVKSFLKEEWNYLRNAEGPVDLPIVDEVWENLDRRIDDKRMTVPQQRNDYDCGLFVLFYMERFIKDAPQRLRKKDLSMFNKQWFRPEEASNLRHKIYDLLVEEFKKAKEKESTLSPHR